MWKCPNCQERLDDQFEACWKCGTIKGDGSDSEFEVSEPVLPEDQAPETGIDESERPTLQLPTVSYFALPVWAWTQLAYALAQFPNLSNPSRAMSFSALQLLFGAAAAILIGIPVLVVFTRDFLHRVRKGQVWDRFWWNPFWMFKVFRPPEGFRKRYSWFVPVYWVSIVCFVVGGTGLMVSSIIWELTNG